MKTSIHTLTLFIAIILSPALLPASTHSGSFTEKEKSIKGSWTIEDTGNGPSLILSADFKAKNGPDLKFFLSPIAFPSTNGKNATKGAILIGELKKTSGAQTYKLPADLDLSAFKSLLLHCEKYSILWGGDAL